MISHRSTKELLLFVVGRPGVGKSAFCRCVKRALGSREVLLLNDYDLLVKRKDNLRDEQIKLYENGQFEILDRKVFDDLLDELARAAEAARGRQVTIVEFARPSYLEAFKRFPRLLEGQFIIIYLDSPLELCVERNRVRAPSQPMNIIPENVIRTYFSQDDRDDLQKEYVGRVRLVDNEKSSLSSLEREAALLLAELLGDDNLLPISTKPFRNEICAAALIVLHTAGFAALTVSAWQVSEASWLGGFAGDPASIPLLKTVALVMAAGGLGSVTHCMRALYHYYIQGSFDFNRFKWWYAFRPLAGSLLALSVFAIAKGGVAAVGVSPSVQPANLTWFGIGYLAGFGTEQVIEWLRRASKSVFGESRVQPGDQPKA
jgi:predicted kinase